MGIPWEPEIEFSKDMAEGLIASQFPGLQPLRVEDYGRGWDNRAFLVNGEWVFRFPQRELARDTMEGELACLQVLPPALPLSIPRPEWIGKAASGYPWPFAGYRELVGRTSCEAELTEEDHAAFAAPLGQFLRELHGLALSPTERASLPGDRLQRADMPLRLPRIEARLAEIRQLPEGVQRTAILPLARELAQATPWEQEPCIVHGDLYGRHLLVNEDRKLSGVIDWGDAHLGDPALDLSILYTALPAAARPVFEATYGPIDPATRLRARYRGLLYGVLLLHYGEQIHDAPMAAMGERALCYAHENGAG